MTCNVISVEIISASHDEGTSYTLLTELEEKIMLMMRGPPTPGVTRSGKAITKVVWYYYILIATEDTSIEHCRSTTGTYLCPRQV